MKPGLLIAWISLAGLFGLAVGWSVNDSFTRDIEMRLKNFPEGVSQP